MVKRKDLFIPATFLPHWGQKRIDSSTENPHFRHAVLFKLICILRMLAGVMIVYSSPKIQSCTYRERGRISY